MDRQPFLISFPSSYPLVISYIHSQHVHVTIPKNSGGKEEEMKEKNAKSTPIGRNSRRRENKMNTDRGDIGKIHAIHNPSIQSSNSRNASPGI
jgi:hypothetical protein